MGEPRLDAEEKNKSLQARWSEVSRRLELWTEFRELNETGQWIPVEVRQQDDVATGGVHQLKQGQQRRLVVGLSLPQHGAGLPLGIDTITSVSIGCVCVCEAGQQRMLDSYQEEDLERIRAQWTLALQSRQKYLEQQLDSLSSISSKSEAELEREHSLMGQWVSLTEERTAVSIPAPNSDIPGAPCDWIPPPGVEEHVPVLFLDLNSDDMTGEMTSDENTPRIAGLHSFLPKEESGGPLVMLPIVHFDDKELIATCSWDSSIHDQPALNVPSSSNERVGVRLSHPCSMELVLRKRVCLNIYKKASLTDRIRKRIVGADPLHRTAVYYDVVAHLPKEEDLERIRAQWTLALQSRQKYLEQQLDSLSSISSKSEAELEREHSLMGQWVSLTEERTAVSIPAPNSDIPGAPCDWIPPPGVEEHVPVLFLDLNSDDMTGEMTSDENTPRIAGLHSFLPKEESGGPLVMLPIVHFDDKELIATCSWDSSIHDQPALNVPSSSNERVYAIVKVGVRLSHPCSMELVLRKRVCLNIYKKASLTDRIRKRIVGADPLHRTAVYYDVVAHLPKRTQMA
ncbi:hypothetical protein ANCDUO_02966 [Ancylostoma duodenale]|uniref:Kinesin-like domain-containing protein n=1 Tax=Ancylostoma duodenale TaxID=51022 RepID=A0A0C2H574_9BILA|nr:hypothetical protein ANCDUO_02966 [Ancylostoma duodenale]